MIEELVRFCSLSLLVSVVAAAVVAGGAPGQSGTVSQNSRTLHHSLFPRIEPPPNLWEDEPI